MSALRCVLVCEYASAVQIETHLGYEIKLMLRYHSVFHSFEFFFSLFFTTISSHILALLIFIKCIVPNRNVFSSCWPRIRNRRQPSSKAKLLRIDEKWIEDVNNNDTFDSISGKRKMAIVVNGGVWFIGQIYG